MKKAKNEYGEFYIIKMDISKFFYTISPNILFDIMESYIKDKRLLDFTYKLIFEGNDKLGIPIGNYTSQFFANIYLNELDYYVKHELKIRYYIRFMDDFVLLVEDKDCAKELFNKIEKFLLYKLELKLNHKSRYYPSSMGVDFCGYRIFITHKLIRNRSKKKMLGRIKRWNYLYKRGILNMKEVKLSLSSWQAHIKHANSFYLEQRYLSKIEFDI